VTRIISKLDANGDKDLTVDPVFETGGSELYTIPLTPPAGFNLPNWNLTSVEFSFRCPDGSTQSTDPCNNPEPAPFDPLNYTYWRWVQPSGPGNWNTTATSKPVWSTNLEQLRPAGPQDWFGGGGTITTESGFIGGVLGRIDAVSLSSGSSFAAIQFIGSVNPSNPFTFTAASFEFSDNLSDIVPWSGRADSSQ
jgi:hypothetical protein